MIATLEWLGGSTIKAHVRVANGVEPNAPPGDPDTPTGPAVALITDVATFTSSCTDVDEDSLYFQWDVNGPSGQQTSPWMGPYAAGSPVTYDLGFQTVGTYDVRVRVKEVWTEASEFTPVHSVEVVCCVNRGDIDDDGQVATIADLVFLVDYMFQGGLEPACLETANANGAGGDIPNIEDLVYLVDFMFNGGPAPVDCTI